MKLKIKNLNWSAGRPVVFLDSKTAKRMNVFVDNRVVILGKKPIHAIVDIFSELLKEGEIGVSRELSRLLRLKTGTVVDVLPAEMSEATFLIRKKMEGKELSKQEIKTIISEIVANNLTEAEIAYFVSAEKLIGMTPRETIYLTEAMIETGDTLKFEGRCIADKHCIGGIAGNRTTPIVVSICAAAGLTLPKTSSRAITSAAGTADTMETIANVELNLNEIKNVVRKTNACLVWENSLGMAPSDDKIIRVERLLNLDVPPQFLASIMSKKIAVGSKYILIDIPYGKKAKVKTIEEAKKLGQQFKKIADYFKIKLKVVYTDGSQPIGNGIGPVLEMQDILKVLRNMPDSPQDLKEKSIYLASEIMSLCGIKNARKKAREILKSGKAYEKFKQIVNAQNKKNNFDKRVSSLRLAKFKRTLRAETDGKILEIGNEEINTACRILGNPESISAGIYLHTHTGIIKKGSPIITLYSESKQRLSQALKYLNKTHAIKFKQGV